MTYAPFGGVKSWILGNGELYARTIDQSYRIAAIAMPAGGGISFAYDAADRITKQNETKFKSKLFDYDPASHLTKHTIGALAHSYEYDFNGNAPTKVHKG